MTPDLFLGGKIQLNQLQDGYRAGMDAAILAASLDLQPGQYAAEFGCGAGAAMLSAAVLYPDTRLIGIERDVEAAALARDNVSLNGLQARVEVIEADALAYKGLRELDAVFFNPPFFDDPKALRAPKAGKAPAWLSDDGLAAWMEAGLKRLKSGGVITVIQRADRLDDLLSALIGRAGGVRVLPIHPRAHEPAKRVLVQARKTAKGPLQVLPALVLHEADGGAFTPQATSVFEGAHCLALKP